MANETIISIVPGSATRDITTTKNNARIKKRGGLHMLRVALYMLRGKSNKQSKSLQMDIGSKGIWNRLVGSMRPLHLQDNPNSESEVKIDIAISKNNTFHDFPASPISPLQANLSDSASSSSASLISMDDSMSRYASAQNLQELDKRSSGDKGVTFEIVVADENGYDDYGDEMIDARAEEFIAKFYEQMRIQEEDRRNRYNEKKQKMKKKIAAEDDDEY